MQIIHTSFAKNEFFAITDNLQDADILWIYPFCNKFIHLIFLNLPRYNHFNQFETLESTQRYINQFPNEVSLFLPLFLFPFDSKK